MKKAYEIAMLCEVDMALIFFAQNGEMTCFEGRRSSIEEVVKKFADTSEDERRISHVQKYTSVEDQLGDTMPKSIENEEMFQEVVRELYESCPKTKTPKCDRSREMEMRQCSLLQDMIKEIRETKCHLAVYDLNLSICNLLSSSMDVSCMELYVQRQLQRIEDCKQQLPQFASSPPEFQIDAQNIIRTGWDTFYTKLGELCSVTVTDQTRPPILSKLSESTNEYLLEGIEQNIICFDDLDDFDSFQKTWEEQSSEQ